MDWFKRVGREGLCDMVVLAYPQTEYCWRGSFIKRVRLHGAQHFDLRAAAFEADQVAFTELVHEYPANGQGVCIKIIV